jgi:Flp pilus assembly protein TadG
MTIHRRLRGTRSPGRRGQALVEFALVIPIFLLLLMALFDMGRAVFAYNTLTNAAREGARIAIVNQDVNSIRDRAKAQTQIVELDDPSVTIQFRKTNTNGTADMSAGGNCSPAAVGCLAIVSFQATYHPITPLISNIVFGSGVTFTATSQLSVEYSCPNTTFAAADCPKQP